MNTREKKVTEQEFRELLASKKIRGASLEDVQGTHHNRSIYKHPRTTQWFVEVEK